MPRVTIYSIARDCGVSAATVSRAFSRPDLVSPEVRERILARSQELDFRPNHLAQRLATGRHGMIGLLLRDITNPFFPPLARTIQQAANARDASVLLVDSEERPATETRLIGRVKGQVDGLIVGAPRSPSGALTDMVKEVPAVVVNRRIPGVSSVVIDYGKAIIDAGRHLVELGHRHVALARGPAASWAGQKRAEQLHAWAAEAGVLLTSLGPFPATLAGGQTAAARVQQAGATAVFAFDDLMACGLLEGLRGADMAVPEHISVVGCVDAMISTATTPRLTSMAAPLHDVGTRAVELLFGQMKGDTPHDVALPAEFVIRDSTGAAA